MPRKIRAAVPRLLAWFATAARDLPWRRTRDPYAIWVSEIMLQQTQVKTVIPYWERWMRELPTLQALAATPPDRLHKLWEGLGYYTRVRNLQRAARQIVAEHGGEFPRLHAEVLALPGIGRYTAGAICSIAFNQPTPILDGNVVRVLTRLFGIDADPKDATTRGVLWELAGQLVNRAAISSPASTDACSHLNQSLMELGAVICTPRNPRCDACPVARLCAARREGRNDQLPRIPRRAPVTRRRFAAFVLRSGNRYLIRQRPAGSVNGHLWEFPNAEATGEAANVAELAEKTLGTATERITHFARVTHSITRYRITLDAYRVSLPAGASAIGLAGRWATPGTMDRLAFTSAHGRLRQRLTPTAGCN